jgi:hypothetical protein
MQADYGFVPNTVAVGDKEDLDVYIGPNANAPKAYVIKQLKEDGTLDEIKVMLGFEDEDEAKQCYLKHYPDGWESRVGSIRELPVSYLKEMVEDHRDGREPRTKAASSVPTLVVTDPVSGQTFAFADFLKNGPNATPLFGIESRPLRLSELRGMD